MKHLLLLLLLIAAALISGCDEKSRPGPVRVSVDYEIDRQFNWDPATRKLKGAIRIKTVATGKELPPQSNAYGISFELSPGDRDTVLVMTDGEGTYFTGEYPDLPIQLPRLLSLQRSEVSTELVDPETCAACEVAISEDSIDGGYCFLFSCFNLKSGWLYNTTVTLPTGKAIADADFISLAKGREDFKRMR